MKPKFFFLIGILTFHTSCMTSDWASIKNSKDLSNDILVIGHRGYAGKYPENSIPAFINGIKKGVDAIELDVVISADRKVVVSHEPYMASDYMLSLAGKPIRRSEEHEFNLFKMNYDSIRKYDSGSRISRRFPLQKNMKTYKPLLKEVFDVVEAFIEENQFEPILYFIELKSEERYYGTHQPLPEEFVNLVVDVVRENQMLNQVVVQSFDPHILNELHRISPDLKISYVVNSGDIEENLQRLNFTPDIYSPNHRKVDGEDVNYVRSKGIKIIPWTVNKGRHIKKVTRLGVDGIITDYPGKVFLRL